LPIEKTECYVPPGIEGEKNMENKLLIIKQPLLDKIIEENRDKSINEIADIIENVSGKPYLFRKE
jgi:hypothetical protein